MQITFTHLATSRRDERRGCVRPARRALPRRRLVVVGTLTTLALLLTGCSNGGSQASSSEGGVGKAPLQDTNGRNSAPGAAAAPGFQGAAGAKAGSPAPAVQADASRPAAPVPGVGPKLTRSASLDLQVEDIGKAAAGVRSIAIGLQAEVLTEQIGKGGPGQPVPLQDSSRQGASRPDDGKQGGFGDLGGYGTLTLSVPADKLDTALDQLGRVGTVIRRNTSSQDVTAQYVDTESRLKTMRASVDRVRALMARATDIGQVVTLESELSRRQADLESLESQLGALKSSVERSTLAISLSTPGNEPVAAKNGFVAGLSSGWNAFLSSAGGLFTAIGAVLPFVLFFALIGVPLWWSWRRRRATLPPVVPATAP